VAQSEQLRIAIVAGENSGDILGADLIKAFRQKYPDAQFMGIAGPAMEAEGCNSLYAMDNLAVMGIWAILKRLPRLLRLRKKLTQQIIDWNADLFIGIDAPEFNLGLELKLKQAGVRTVHYVSPSVWAWREKRIFKIKKAVDYMLTLFPFELAIYKKHGIPASCVGHPLAQLLPLETDMQAARVDLGLKPENKVLAMLPGSRGSEIKYIGQLLIETANRLKVESKDLQIVVPLVNERRRQQFTNLLDTVAPELDITLVDGKSREVMCAADAVLLASGTATLEAMLLKKPMLVVYKVSALSYFIYSRLLKIKHFALPNLLAKTPMVEELMQDDATVDAVAAGTSRMLETGLDDGQLEEYREIHGGLRLGGGEKGVSDLIAFFDLGNRP